MASTGGFREKVCQFKVPEKAYLSSGLYQKEKDRKRNSKNSNCTFLTIDSAI